MLLPSQSLATNSETSAPGLFPELFAVYCVLRIERSRCRDLLGLAPVLLLSIVIVSMCSFVPFGRRIGVLCESDCKVNASFSNHQIFVRFLTLVFLSASPSLLRGSRRRPSSEKRVQSYALFLKPPNVFEGIFEEKFLIAEYQNSTDDEIHMDIRSDGTKGVRSGGLEVRVS